MQHDWLNILATPLPTAAAVDFVSSPEAGGVAIFLGTTRTETSPDGHPLLALHYESYAEMAARQLQELAQRVREKWPVLKLVVLHRTGRGGGGPPPGGVAGSSPPPGGG